jgi:hypothetical protein
MPSLSSTLRNVGGKVNSVNIIDDRNLIRELPLSFETEDDYLSKFEKFITFSAPPFWKIS